MFWCILVVSETVPDHSGHFWKNRNFLKKNNVDFARVSFQFLARGLRAVWRIPGLTTCLGRFFQGIIETRAVLAGVAKTHRKNQLEGLKLPSAVGPFKTHQKIVRSTLLPGTQSENEGSNRKA